MLSNNKKKEFFESEIRLQPNKLRFYNSGGTFIKLPNRDHSVFSFLMVSKFG